MGASWKDTFLWKELAQREDEVAARSKNILEIRMPEVEKILKSGGTSPTDFTLHDDGHSFRVAQRMVEVMPENMLGLLSSCEITLLILSAYLHDIGMTPEAKKVNQHYDHLVFGAQEIKYDQSELTAQEIQEFQEWLDDYMDAIEPPFSLENPFKKRKAHLIISHYCRYRHNDWSEDWIRKYIERDNLKLYHSWVDDLVAICRSHHEGYSKLNTYEFDPTLRFGDEIVHRRFLACVLRIADILEFDPERTPQIVFYHRDISPGSSIYWYKDHEVSLKVNADGSVLLVAEPSNAQLHYALETMADEIESELRLCRRLADETKFEKYPGPHADLPHKWKLQASIHRKIRPKNEAYEYINGAFRPDTEKLLELLAGVELYGNPLVASREILQNAMDAVKEQIALLRLLKENPSASHHAVELGAQHQIKLALEYDQEDRLCLKCSDNGVGMTKTVIEKYLLVSGRATRHNILDLERRCHEHEFELERTGRFGIGVLSYFMLADRIEFTTRRSIQAEGNEGHGWDFVTEGAGSFGELRRNTEAEQGTTVYLRLKESIINYPEKFSNDLRNALLNYLVYLPCNVTFESSVCNQHNFEFTAGWAWDFTLHKNVLLEQVLKFQNKNIKNIRLLSIDRQSEYEILNEEVQRLKDELETSLKWKSIEGLLPDNLGRYRVIIPYFDLPGGASMAYLGIVEEEGVFKPQELLSLMENVAAYLPLGFERIACYGILLENQEREAGPYYDDRNVHTELRSMILEMDIINLGSKLLPVTRDCISFSKVEEGIFDELSKQIKDKVQHLVCEENDSLYALLNHRLTKSPLNAGVNLNWITPQKEWAQVKGPTLIPGPYFNDINSTDRGLQYKGKYLTWRGEPIYEDVSLEIFCRPMQSMIGRILSDPLRWHSAGDINAVGYCEHLPDDHKLVVIFDSEKGLSQVNTLFDEPTEISSCEFPGEWNDISMISFHLYDSIYQHYYDLDVWNQNHVLCNAITANKLKSPWQDSELPIDPLEYKDQILSSIENAATWFLGLVENLSRYNSEPSNAKAIWLALPERDENFLPSFFKLLSLHSGRDILQILIYSQKVTENIIWKFTEDNIIEVEFSGKLMVPVPNSKWHITFADDLEVENQI